MAVSVPNNTNDSLSFENVSVDSSTKFGLQDSAVQGIVATMGSLVSGISTQQLNTIKDLNTNLNATQASASNFSKQTIVWLGVGALILIAFLLRKR